MSEVPAARPAWLSAFRRYLLAIAAANLAWETLQLPLYAIWRTGSPREIAVAVLHCTAGDVLIALAALTATLCVLGEPEWPRRGFLRVAIVTILIGLGYTLLSEWLNVSVRRSWAYSEWMPQLPLLGTGLSPVLQWLVVPVMALMAAQSRGSHRHALQANSNDRVRLRSVRD